MEKSPLAPPSVEDILNLSVVERYETCTFASLAFMAFIISDMDVFSSKSFPSIVLLIVIISPVLLFLILTAYSFIAVPPFCR